VVSTFTSGVAAVGALALEVTVGALAVAVVVVTGALRLKVSDDDSDE